jgi:pyridinium-3,5-bisthiocarboxylic acid mononucleotide nickel chelatase
MVMIIDPQQAGISGNMVVGALVNLGTDPAIVSEIMEHYGSHFGDVKIQISEVNKSGISATFVDVKCSDHQPIAYKNLLNVLDGIRHEKVNSNILKFAKNTFQTIANAESKIHGSKLDEIHFHEVGAADAVADVIGAAFCFNELGFYDQKVYGLPTALGGGRIRIKHGDLSVPAPVTLEILKNVPAVGGPEGYELTTPTGAAILVNIVDEFSYFYPLITNRKIGYGAGNLDLEMPNILRIIRGDRPLKTDKVSILETNLDNTTGEVVGHIFSRLLEVGALDVTVIPTITKKNRPGQLLRVVTRPSDCDTVAESIIRETGTLGVRVLPYIHRNIASRKVVSIKVIINGKEEDVRIKVGMIGNEIINYSPEFEDAHKISKKTGLPLKDVIKKSDAAFKDFIENKDEK